MALDTMKIKVPQNSWHGDSWFQIELPHNWIVEICRMAGENKAALTDEDIRLAFNRPIGTKRISELAKGKKEAVIVFDDLSRPTKASRLIPTIIKELKEAGIKKDSLRFISGIGMHGAMKLSDFQKKLGRTIPDQYDVYNHNPYENCIYIGKTSRNTPVYINREVMNCDLKIFLGGIVPHPTAGFGGGAKMIVGISGIDTIFSNHHHVGGRGRPTSENPMGNLHPSLKCGNVEGSVLRKDLEEMAMMAKIDCIINAVFNLKREIVGLFVGDVVRAHRKGTELAKKVYATTSTGNYDILLLNVYSKANEASIVFHCNQLLKSAGGDVVLICNTPEGQICHYTARSFGKKMGGRLWGPRSDLPPRVNRLIAVGSNISKTCLDMIGPADKIIRVKRWQSAHSLLKEWHHREDIKIGVVPDASIQFFPGWE